MNRSALLALILLARIAHADDPKDPKDPKEPQGSQNPRDVFGLANKPEQPKLDCSDGLAFGCAQATDPLADSVPYALSTWLPASYLLQLPVADATHDQVASYALGASRDEAGVSFAGANGLENRWLIDGAPADNIRTGAVDTRVPLVFLDGILVTAGGFAARDRTSTGGVIDAILRKATDDHELDVRAFVTWTSDARHSPIVAQTYQVRRGSVETGPGASFSVVATGPIGSVLGGKAWYVLGIAPSLSAVDFTWTAARLTDRDHDMVPDGLPGVVTTEGNLVDKQRDLVWAVPVLARAGFDRGAHHVDVSVVGTAGSDTYNLFNSTIQAAGVDRFNVIGDAIATYRGQWKDTHARLQLAWHRATHHESAHDPAAANIPQLLSAYVPETLAEDPALAALCSDNPATDPYPDIPNCPIPFGWFTSGGAGTLVDTTADRPSITADVTHRFGANTVRAGATGEDSRLVTDTRFTGGELIRSLFPGHTSERFFIDPDSACSTDVTKPCPHADHSTLTFRTRYTAAYIEDTWAAAPNISVDGGLRWELMWVGTALHFSNELAPRFGMTWDPLGGGRSRVWTSMGRSFAMLPAGLGSTILHGNRTVDEITTSFGQSRSIDAGLPLLVVPGIEPVAQDEVTLGGEVAVSSAVRATAWVLGRWLHRGLDTTMDGFDNPGHASGDVPATRETAQVAVQLETAPTSSLALRAGYIYGSTVGSWTGAFDPRQGAVLYAGADFDTPAINQLGPLPTSVGHRFYLEAQRGGSIGSVKLAVTTRLTVGSGRPRNVLAFTDYGMMQLLPRGSAGSGELLTQANVRLAATWRGFTLTLDVFNVFDRREPTNLDEVYATGSVYPIDGGTPADLVFLKTEIGKNALRTTTYGVPTAFQLPLSAALGIHRSF